LTRVLERLTNIRGDLTEATALEAVEQACENGCFATLRERLTSAVDRTDRPEERASYYFLEGYLALQGCDWPSVVRAMTKCLEARGQAGAAGKRSLVVERLLPCVYENLAYAWARLGAADGCALRRAIEEGTALARGHERSHCVHCFRSMEMDRLRYLRRFEEALALRHEMLSMWTSLAARGDEEAAERGKLHALETAVVEIEAGDLETGRLRLAEAEAGGTCDGYLSLRLMLLHAQALLAVRSGDSPGAARTLARARETVRPAEHPYLAGQLEARAAEVALEDGRPQEARAACRRALRLLRAGGDRMERLRLYRVALEIARRIGPAAAVARREAVVRDLERGLEAQQG